MPKTSVAILISFVFVLIAVPTAHAAGLAIGSGSQMALNDGSLNVGGDVAITGTLTVASGSINLTGNWSKSGNFTAGTGMVTFDGTNQTLSGATSFYDLTKNVNAADTLTFTSGTANKTIITNTLNLSGASGNLLSLRSSSAGTQWEIDPQGTRTIAYLDVKDSKNVNEAATINAVGTKCVSSGNNTGWIFVNAGTYYVDIDPEKGNDSNAGTAAAPWKTLHHAIYQINGGTTGTSALPYALIMAAGTYNITGNGEADTANTLTQSYVTIVGDSNDPPVIDGSNADDWTKGLEITGSYVTVENLYVTGFSDEAEEGIRISENADYNKVRMCKLYGNNWGIHVNRANRSEIRGCEIYQNTTHGIDITWCTNTVIVGNKVYSNPQYGIRVQCSPEISRNLIYDNDDTGILVEAVVNGDISSPTIKNNVIYKTASGTMSYSIYTEANATSDETAVASPVIYHNTIDGGAVSGIYMKVSGMGSLTSVPTIKYNNITNFGQYGIQNSGASPTIEYNDIWNNASGSYSGGAVSNTNKNVNPQYVDATNEDYSLQSDTNKFNFSTAGDTETLDYPGFTRPRFEKTTKNMGAYEYIANVTNNYTLPGGTGAATDYRIFTVPLNLGTGANMLTAMENVLGAYDPVHWRGFLYSGTSYREFNSSEFASATIKPGMGFWIITTYTSQIPFQGGPAPDGVDYVMTLDPGWHLIALPWTGTHISLGNMTVTDGVNSYSITGQPDNARLTQEWVWDYTGSGYVQKGDPDYQLEYNKGYFFKVEAASSIRLTIPLNNNQGQDAPIDVPPNQTNTNEDDEAPPPPPGSEPIPDIKANGQDGPVTVSAGDSVSVSVNLDPGAWNGRNADWWVAAHTPFDWPLDWYTYVYPEGWRYGIHVCVQTPLYELTPSFNVLNTVLPPGDYIFYFAVDGNMDGEPDATWLDYVEVLVE
jgi:parallel beta-helix repeat protein